MAAAGVGTPLWWVAKLEKELGERRRQIDVFEDYYEGDHPLPFLTRNDSVRLRAEFKQLLEDSRTNFMRLVIDAVEERLRVEGFRLSASSDGGTDKATWDIWQANQMDVGAPTAMLEALMKGVSYLSVWLEPDADHPTIAVEDAMETIISYAAGSNFTVREAALKIWCDEIAELDRANLYLPDGIYKFQRIRKDGKPSPDQAWAPIAADGSEFVENPLGVVPIIALRNRPRLKIEGESEISDLIQIQNQINAFTFLLALAGYFGAHKQRWAVGVKIHEDDDGKDVEPFKVGIDKLWVSEDPDVKFGEFTQTDLAQYVNAIEQKILHIAVTSRTPRHYLVQAGQSPSGDAIRSAESGLVKKTIRKQGPFGEAFEEALNLARQFAGLDDVPVDSEIVWAAPDTPTLAETTDAVIKQFNGGLIPWEAAVTALGYTQTEIARFASMRQDDAILVALRAAAIQNAGGKPDQAALTA